MITRDYIIRVENVYIINKHVKIKHASSDVIAKLIYEIKEHGVEDPAAQAVIKILTSCYLELTEQHSCWADDN